MRVLTYLGFTVLSIFIQFCVMDFIQDKIQVNENPIESNITYQKKSVDDLLKNITNKPHALFYRTDMSKTLKKSPGGSFLERIYSNSSVTAVPLGSTDITTTILDILYDENTSSSETATTTETFFSTTEFDNVTEITFFEIKNKSAAIPNAEPKISFSKHCGCNLLFKVCDINCCCDQDCTNDELNQFQCETKNNNRLYSDGCVSHLLDGDLGGTNSFDSLFCVVKTNLPNRRNMKKPNLVLADYFSKWKIIDHRQNLFEFKKIVYKQGDPIWLLKNGTIYYLDIPMPMINNYCTDRAPITFLKEEQIQCTVKFSDLEMFHISKTEESVIISATESTFNSTTLNCSNLHCINWTILVCDSGICKNYNKSLNEASCTDSSCKNVALRIEYNFYYYDLKIINATIKLHIQKVLPNVLPFMPQEVTVKFIMANKSLDHVIEFSGNPGYIRYLPIIISNAESNFTENFFNNTLKKNHLIFPENQNGMCFLSNTSKNVVRFGTNRRTKCRYVHADRIITKNYTSVCNNIQDNINAYLGLQKEVLISPYGNPYGIKDENWIKLKTEVHQQERVYGKYTESGSKMHCFNIINRVSIIFTFANVDENDFTNQNKIIFAKYEVVPVNISFNVEEFSTVLTIDVNFVDATKPNHYIYAGSPHLNIHLPKDFFFPFRPNNYCYRVSNTSIITIFCCTLIFFSNKITLE